MILLAVGAVFSGSVSCWLISSLNAFYAKNPTAMEIVGWSWTVGLSLTALIPILLVTMPLLLWFIVKMRTTGTIYPNEFGRLPLMRRGLLGNIFVNTNLVDSPSYRIEKSGEIIPLTDGNPMMWALTQVSPGKKRGGGLQVADPNSFMPQLAAPVNMPVITAAGQVPVIDAIAKEIP